MSGLEELEQEEQINDVLEELRDLDTETREQKLAAFQSSLEESLPSNDQFRNKPIRKIYYKSVPSISLENDLIPSWRPLKTSEKDTHVRNLFEHVKDYCEASDLEIKFEGNTPYSLNLKEGQQYAEKAEAWAKNKEGETVLKLGMSATDGYSMGKFIPIPMVKAGIRLQLHYDPKEEEDYQQLNMWMNDYNSLSIEDK